jgi:hypothetical protein
MGRMAWGVSWGKLCLKPWSRLHKKADQPGIRGFTGVHVFVKIDPQATIGTAFLSPSTQIFAIFGSG